MTNLDKILGFIKWLVIVGLIVIVVLGVIGLFAVEKEKKEGILIKDRSLQELPANYKLYKDAFNEGCVGEGGDLSTCSCAFNELYRMAGSMENLEKFINQFAETGEIHPWIMEAIADSCGLDYNNNNTKYENA